MLTVQVKALLLSILLNCMLVTPAYSQSFLLESAPEFLPVEQAFQWVPSIGTGEMRIHWQVAPNYYLYRERTAVRAFTTQGGLLNSDFRFAAEGLQKYDDYFERETQVYYLSSEIFVKVTPVQSPVYLEVETQGCADAGLCYPPQTKWFEADFSIGSITELSAPPSFSEAANERDTVSEVAGHDAVTGQVAAPPILTGTTLLLALLGGLILNLMPCVFPVLSLKVFGFAGRERREVQQHAWLYCVGVILSFAAVGVVMLALRHMGMAIGWGFQLQQPWFVTVLVYLFFILGLAFAGVVHLGHGLMGVGQQWLVGGGRRAAFFTGVLAVVVASPCSVPFMGVAMGAALTQHWIVALGIFATLGLGLALPFLVLAYAPGLIEKLPAPGLWMQTLQQFFAFPLFATGLWLLWVLGKQVGLWGSVLVASGCLLLVFGGWAWLRLRIIGKAIALMSIVLALCLPWQLEHQQAAVPSEHVSEDALLPGLAAAYTQERLAALRAQDKAVFVNLTASWCITCLVNEKVALHRQAVQAHMQNHEVYYLVGDWTNRNAEITALLNQYQRSGVPLYLYFAPGADRAAILPQVLTEAALIEALQ